MSYFFKYYRTNFYFEKAIKYNELYFSKNEELNDPSDLKVNYVFEDSIELWEEIFTHERYPNGIPSDLRNPSKFIDIKNVNLLNEINNLFKGTEVTDQFSALNKLLDEKNQEIHSIFTKYIFDDPTQNNEDLIKLLIFNLKYRLTFAINQKIYSVSFTTDALNSLMWAHYADGFKGCVVIYKTKEDLTIDLKHHYLSSVYDLLSFHKVTYKDEAKNIPFLKSAICKDNLINACFSKNSFWTYEEEFRLLTSNEMDPLHMIHEKKEVPTLRDRVLYHNPDAIVGIICGPRLDKEYINKLQIILSDNQCYGENSSYFIFLTELGHNGNIKIIEGKEIFHKNKMKLQKVYKDSILNELLVSMSIKNK